MRRGPRARKAPSRCPGKAHILLLNQGSEKGPWFRQPLDHTPHSPPARLSPLHLRWGWSWVSEGAREAGQCHCRLLPWRLRTCGRLCWPEAQPCHGVGVGGCFDQGLVAGGSWSSWDRSPLRASPGGPAGAFVCFLTRSIAASHSAPHNNGEAAESKSPGLGP